MLFVCSVSSLLLACSFACLIVYVCVRACVRLRDGHEAGFRSIPLAAGLVLRKAIDAVQLA